MRRRWTLTAAAAAVCAATALSAGASTGPAATAPAASRPSAGNGYVPASQIAHGGPIHGVVLVDVKQPPSEFVAELDRLAADGVNLVNIYVAYFMADRTSSAVQSGPQTPTDAELTAAIELAHARGLAVELSPMVWSAGLTYTWRGAFQPHDVNAWFGSYRQFITHYASLAQTTGVELFQIGSEYSWLEQFDAQWRGVARAVRGVYRGPITYMTVTQHLASLTWWSAVDLASDSPYYWLSGSARPTYDEMKRQWQTRWIPAMRRVALRIKKPVLLNEIGYLSALGTTRDPSNWQTSQPASEALQADAYRALLDVTSDQPWVRGIVWYKWSTPAVAPMLDTSYSPRDKVAECVIAEHWGPNSTLAAALGAPATCAGGMAAAATGLAERGPSMP